MTFIVTLVAIVQSFAISLGVGSSTLAILNFFTAIADGTIDPTERRMMGIVYKVLRVAMGLIMVTTLFLIFSQQGNNLNGLSAFSLGQITALAVLFLNATLMTLHIMPSTFGPAIQAGSWYTLGTLAAQQSLQLTDFSYLEFLLGYLAWIVLAIGVVNGAMELMKAKREANEKQS